ncbi:putative hydrolase/coenzyme F420 biosynthesis associated uncharacterized protein [Sediminihabitans luteus]|uniref:Putative hydrolase/coenzyme F420 biosynthesis associated uncharacterized protein n=1 Tax=Sediminihabitans luteus TaxID=1138585 RepID=A0A2M9CE77_9CELL|nr:zinc-dependent metalloprotease [Sediminihabitans luteus]PJJ70246.1 putative hydrolase/coenzyme F420 biosynthesis associated uncharacterized protein [Sediminihabitans luteus]
MTPTVRSRREAPPPSGPSVEHEHEHAHARSGDVAVVDWPVAAQVAGRLANPGPSASRDELDALVAGLRDAAARAVPAVLDVTRMRPAPESAATSDRLSDVYVVDRARWALANTEVMASMTDPLMAGLSARERSQLSSPVTSLVGATQVGGVLAALSSRVLGQFDPYAVGGDAAAPPLGRLLLVAPNVLHAERSMRVRAADFRLWVCLHEQTHALQFAAAPWLVGHLRGRMGELVDEVTNRSREMSRARWDARIAGAGRALVSAVRGRDGVLDGLLGPGPRRTFEEMTAVMALLEGHADVAMDDVGPRVVPTVRQIRRKFEERRDGAGRGPADGVLRRVLGMDAKLAQYRDGAAFVRGVEREVGRDGFNAVWTSPATLPTAAEIADPGAWVRRVHG